MITIAVSHSVNVLIYQISPFESSLQNYVILCYIVQLGWTQYVQCTIPYMAIPKAARPNNPVNLKPKNIQSQKSISMRTFVEC